MRRSAADSVIPNDIHVGLSRSILPFLVTLGPSGEAHVPCMGRACEVQKKILSTGSRRRNNVNVFTILEPQMLAFQHKIHVAASAASVFFAIPRRRYLAQLGPGNARRRSPWADGGRNRLVETTTGSAGQNCHSGGDRRSILHRRRSPTTVPDGFRT